MEDTSHLILPVNSTIAQAEELLKEMRDLFVLGQPISVDASQVEKVDTAIIQLLVSLKKTLTNNDQELVFSAVNTVVKNAFNALALDSFFNLEQN